MKTDRMAHNYSILKSVEPEKVSGELICKRIESPYYITNEHTVDVVVALFNNDHGLQALGVVDMAGKAIGIITRNDLFDLIGQKFGRELYMNKGISDIIKSVNLIYYKRNTFSIIEEISDDLKSAENRYHILVDSENNYKGFISSFNIVLFLSEMMTRELKSARKVHSAIVRDEININTEKLSVSGSTAMAGETGGDLQYIRKIGDNRLFISLCDVSGKGLNAGFIAVAVSSMYAAYDFDKGVSGLIKTINSFIYDLFDGDIFLTGVFIEIDESNGKIKVYDMGHSMIYILEDNKVHHMESHAGNYPLGIMEYIEPSLSETSLAAGDLLISFSDGFPEQNSNTNEMFGEQRLLSLAMKYHNSSLKQIKDIIFEELKTWKFGQAQSDDMSLLMLKYK